MERFRDRADAGEKLAGLLVHLESSNPFVLGLARGGIEVAAKIAERLDSPLDVLVARKIGAPFNPEYGIGAIAPGGIAVYDEEAVRRLRISPDRLDSITNRERAEVDRRLRLYRGNRPLDLSGKCAILVDDGLATGITATAAARYLRSLAPERLVMAVPVSSQEGAELLRKDVDEFITLGAPPFFSAVGAWYDDFSQTTDEQVVSLLRQSEINRCAS